MDNVRRRWPEHQEDRVMRGDVLPDEGIFKGAQVLPLPDVPHEAPRLASQAGHVGKPQGQRLSLRPVVQHQYGHPAAPQRLAEELPTGDRRRVIGAVLEDHGRACLLERAAAVPGPGLVHCDGLLVRDDRPDQVRDGIILQVMRKRQRRGDDGPCAKVRAHLDEAQPWVAGPAGPVLAAHLEHVRVAPAAGLREALLRPLDCRQEVPHNTRVGGAYVAAGAEEIPWAPRGVGHSAAPMAILNHHPTASAVEQPRPEVEVELRAAAIQLHGIEAEDREGGYVALVHGLRRRLVLGTDAVVAVPSCREAELVRMARHGDHVGEAVRVDDGDPGVVVVVVLVACTALLPVVVEANVAVAQVAEGRRHPVHLALLGDHLVHDGLNERLVHVRAKEVPGAPPHGGPQTQPIVMACAAKGRRDTSAKDGITAESWAVRWAVRLQLTNFKRLE
eukprot:CAMPEP_0175322276 /NCGR_PEP_ID=MMETSP0093-20121207/72392_1 /TAXON_ID=311494 /ORGANISM="Alexandrium monilatum, Strain CCMP3105" /LENGTH=445 /DNA_ID=CAMNT_0016619161 /DNA_START=204 /DNA_END=1539 /DNA_ORIENTATION=-